METFKWIWGYLKDYKFRYGACLVLVLIAALISMINPILGGTIVDRVLEGGETNILVPILLVTMIQRKLETKEYGVGLPKNPNFAAIVRAYGIEAYRIDDPDKVEEILKQAIASDKPQFLEFIVSDKESTL